MAIDITETDRATNKMAVISIDWKKVPWYKRLLSVAELPMQLARFLFTGRADILCVRNVKKLWP